MKIYLTSELLKANLSPTAYYIKPLLPVGCKAIIFGLFKSGKSFLAQQIALELAAGKPVLGIFPTTKCKVLYLENELPETSLQKRLVKPFGVYKGDFYVARTLAKLNDWEGYLEFREVIEKVEPNVIIIDCLYSAVVGDISEGVTANSSTTALDGLLSIVPNSSMIIIHHQRKQSKEREDAGMEEMLGSIQIAGWADTLIRLIPSGEKKTLRFVLRHDESPYPLTLSFNPKTLLFSAKAVNVDNAEEFIKDLLEKRELTRKDLVKEAEKHDLGRSTLDKALGELKKKGMIISRGLGREGTVYELTEKAVLKEADRQQVN